MPISASDYLGDNLTSKLNQNESAIHETCNILNKLVLPFKIITNFIFHYPDQPNIWVKEFKSLDSLSNKRKLQISLAAIP